MLIFLTYALTSSSSLTYEGGIANSKNALSSKRVAGLDNRKRTVVEEGQKAFVNEKQLFDVYLQLKVNSGDIISKDSSNINPTDDLLIAIENAKADVLGNFDMLVKGVDVSIRTSYWYELIELGIIIYLNKCYRYEHMCVAIDKVFGYGILIQNRLYDKILDHINDSHRKISVFDMDLTSDIDKLILYVLANEILTLVQVCHTKPNHLIHFMNHPTLIKKSINRILNGVNNTGYEYKFVFFDLLYNYVNDKSLIGFLDKVSYRAHEKAMSQFVDYIFKVYQSFARHMDCNNGKNIMIKYSFPILNKTSKLRYGIKGIIRNHTLEKELWHLLNLPFTYCSGNKKKVTITKIVSRETGRRLEKITESLPFRRLGFFAVPVYIHKPHVHDPCTLDALGLQYNADVLECGISHSMMLLPVKCADSTLLADQIFIIISWLSAILRKDDNHVSFNFTLPDTGRSYDVRKFIPSSICSKKVELFFDRCGLFNELNPSYEIYTSTRAAKNTFEELVVHILEGYFTDDEQKNLLKKYNLLKEREAYSFENQQLLSKCKQNVVKQVQFACPDNVLWISESKGDNELKK